MSSQNFITVCHGIAQSGVALFLQSGLVLLLGLSLAALLRRRGPLVQSLALRTALAAVLLTAGLSVSLTPYAHPLWRVSLSDAPAPPQAVAPPVTGAPALPQTAWTRPAWAGARASEVRSMAPAVRSDPPPLADDPAAPAPTPINPKRTAPQIAIPLTRWFCPILVAVWGTGTLCLLAWSVIGQVSLCALRRRSIPVTTGIAADTLHGLRPARPLPLRVSPHIRSPFLGGLWQPTVFLPASYAADFDGPTLQAILAHELAHRDRSDNHWMLLARLLCAILWVQPLCWVLARSLEQTAEEACDALALRSGCSPRAYADCLLSLAQRLTPSSLERVMGVGSVPLRSQVGKRIRTILDWRSHPMSQISQRATILLTLSLAAAAVCGALFVSAGAAPSASTKDAAQATVQEYLDARAAGQYQTAFGLLTGEGLNGISLQNWSQGLDLSYTLHRTQSLPPSTVIDAFFEDTRNTLGAEYRVIGAVPGRPDVVQVSVHLPNRPDDDVTLRIALRPERGPFSDLRIDLMKSVQETVPSEYPRFVRRAEQRLCVSHLKQLGLAMMEYIQDHGEHYPHAAHWVDEIMPYVKDVSLFHDPAAPASQRYSYAFNRNLSGLSLARLNSPAQTLMVFDSSKGVKNASDTGQSLPRPGRHLDGNDFLFADGHPKYLREWRNQATFSVSGALPTQTQSDSVAPPPDPAATECAAHLKLITSAVTRYAQDHQGHLPDAARWMDETLPYVKDASVFHDPGAHPTQHWSYAYNQFLSGAPIGQFGPAQTVVVFDTERNFLLDPVDGIKNASNPGDALPYPGRHQGFNVFGFLDGHTQTLPTGQKPPFKIGAVPPTVARPSPAQPTSDRLVFVRAYQGRLTAEATKAKQDWLDFKQSHPVTLSAVQIAQVNTLVNLRLQRNDLTGQMRMNALLRAKHVARLAQLGPGQQAERRKRQAAIAALDARTLRDEQQMAGIEQKTARQEALVQPFADDYLAVRFKEQQYDIAQSENITVRQVDASVRGARKAAMLQEQAQLQRQLAEAQRQLVVCERNVKTHPLPTSALKPFTGYLHKGVPVAMSAKQDFIRAVHEHNNRVVAHWDAVVKLDAQRRKVERQQKVFKAVGEELSALNSGR